MNKNYILSFVFVLLAIVTTRTSFAKTANVSITYPLSGVSLEVGVPQTIKWTFSDYPAKAGVNINLLRQVSSNPNKFEFVKAIKKDAKNDGEEIWIPAVGDNGNNFVIQVSCSQSFVFPEGCSSANVSDHLAVIDKINRQSYTARAISSINEIIKKISDFLNSLR